ncbi:MAG TPA: hypothetical protein PLU49_06265 [Saprospiraceae bacterium]|nr:hypothetical protein [Saprospiraceae bacterium]
MQLLTFENGNVYFPGTEFDDLTHLDDELTVNIVLQMQGKK